LCFSNSKSMGKTGLVVGSSSGQWSAAK